MEDIKENLKDLVKNNSLFRESSRLPWFFAGALVGAAAAYLFDPKEGSQRRAAIREQGTNLTQSNFLQEAKRMVQKVIPGVQKSAKDNQEQDKSYVH